MNVSKEQRRFMRLIQLCMTSMICVGMLIGFYIGNALGGLISGVWFVFLCTAALVTLDRLNQRKNVSSRAKLRAEEYGK